MKNFFILPSMKIRPNYQNRGNFFNNDETTLLFNYGLKFELT